ncbi:MAG: argininosuccinate lyase [Anaerolineae bacterium]|jgi:argininosuccinate lyase
MKLWGGRFAAEIDATMQRFNDSIGFDRRLHRADVRGSIAYAGALLTAGLLSAGDHEALVAGLEAVGAELEAGTFGFQAGDEDIHTAVERRLGELAGPVAGKLHTGRSRNDQVSTDLRLYLMEQIDDLDRAVAELQAALVDKAEQHLDLIMPGYTHLQPAQPVLFSHWLMSYVAKLERDRARLAAVRQRTSVLPLGAGALAGNPFAIDRRALAAALGFEAVAHNSLDAVADRDYAVEFLAWAALIQVHLSSLAEDLVIWSSREFGFVRLDEAYATGSSLMPQKVNPDSLELMRGKSGRIVGHLTGLLVVLKGLPSTYNKDLQEDKEALFDTIDTLKLELPIAAAVLRTLNVNGARMAAALDAAMLATDLADYLVRKGIPFRQSHHLVGRVVRRAEELGTSLTGMALAEYRDIDPAFGPDLYDALDFQASVAARATQGGTAPAAVRAEIDRVKAQLAAEADVPNLAQRGLQSAPWRESA